MQKPVTSTWKQRLAGAGFSWREQKAIWAKAKALAEGRAVYGNRAPCYRPYIEGLAEELRQGQNT